MFEKFFGSKEEEGVNKEVVEEQAIPFDEGEDSDPLIDALKQDEGRRKEMINDVRKRNEEA